MLRKCTLALATAAAVGSAVLSTSAFAFERVSPQSVAVAIAHASQVTMPNLTTAATGHTTLTTIIALLTSPTAITAANREQTMKCSVVVMRPQRSGRTFSVLGHVAAQSASSEAYFFSKSHTS
jgi:hypothetical protein